MKSKNYLLLICSICISVLLLEFGLRWLTIFPIHQGNSNMIKDDFLGYRFNPTLKGIDSNGFRNKSIPDSVEIVALGDSHTFGYNVISEDAWPQQLARMTNKTVYNFGIGGYGGLQYYHLLDEAIKLKPKYIILGLYLSNDLSDICNLINKNRNWQEWAINRGYNIDSISNFLKSEIDTKSNSFQRKIIAKTKRAFRSLAIGSSISYFSKKPISSLQFKRGTKRSKKNDVIINEEINKTIIKYSRICLRERYTNIDNENIKLAYTILLDIFYEAKKRSEHNDIQFCVLFIPSRINVFFDYLKENNFDLPQKYFTMVENERKLVDSISVFLKNINIKSVNAKPDVVQKLYNVKNIYPSNDGHPFKEGQSAYAKAAYEAFFHE